MFFLSVLALLFLRSVALVNAAIFILEPFKNATCHAGESCTVSWEDDGEEPLLSAWGVSTVGLYKGNQCIIQSLRPVNVATAASFTFKPLPEAGPNYDKYYIAITSTQVNDSEGKPYVGYSPFFRLRGMSGSFDSPLAAATSTVPIPQSIKNPSTPSPTSTTTVGTLTTTLSQPSSSPLSTSSVPSSVSRLSTSISSVPLSTTSLASAPAKSNGRSSHPSHLPGPLPVLFLVLFCSFFL